MSSILASFFDSFEASFQPPAPRLSLDGYNWLVSKVWSDYVRAWLPQHYPVTEFECLGRLDAALWSCSPKGGPMDIALEWEWDNKKYVQFADGDFRKVMIADARCGVAIIQTRADGRVGTQQADNAIKSIRSARATHRQDDRPVGVVELRRLSNTQYHVDFICRFHDLDSEITRDVTRWRFP